MFLNAGMGEIEAEKHKKAKRVTTSLPPKLYEYVASRVELYGSKSAYLRYLILRDRDIALSNPKQTTLRQRTVTELTTVSGCDPPRRREVKGYANLHRELIAELKERFKEKGD